MEIKKTLGELDKLFEEKRYCEVERYLLSKIEEAEIENDNNSLLALFNELLGFYRSFNHYNDSIVLGNRIISLMKKMGIEGTVPYATSVLNIATAFREAGKIDEAMTYYTYVLKIYKNTLPENDMRLASLYNNMSQACIGKKDYQDAYNLLEKALSIVVNNEEMEIEEAITKSNLAIVLTKLNNLTEALKQINESLKIFENRVGQKDFHYSASLSAMGEIQLYLNNHEIALEYFKKALDEIENNMGKNRRYAITCKNISSVYDKMNNTEQKEKYRSMADAIINEFKE